MYSKQRGSPYGLVNVYPVNTFVGEVACAQFDGVFYWTLEKQTGGFTIKKWELVGGILRQRAIFSYTTIPGMTFDADSFTVDYYNDVLTSSATLGSSYLEVTDGDNFNIGDTVVLGPSTAGGFSDQYESASISSKVGDTLYLSTPLTKSFSSGDALYATRYFYVFNKYSPYDNSKGSLLKYKWDTGKLYSYYPSHMFGAVTATCFYDGRITFVKGNEVILLNTSTLNVFRHFAIDNLETNRAGIVPIHALWVYSDVLYRLQGKYVFFNEDIEEWDEELWGSVYSYVSGVFPTIFVSTVYFVEIKAYPPMIHAIASGITSSTSNIVVTVLNQDRTPLAGRTVTMTSSYGSILPTSGTTDSNGQLECVYSGSVHVTEVEIKASVT